jgi:hypothetical protein
MAGCAWWLQPTIEREREREVGRLQAGSGSEGKRWGRNRWQRRAVQRARTAQAHRHRHRQAVKRQAELLAGESFVLVSKSKKFSVL